MPRARLTPEARLAAASQRTARWRARVARLRNQSQQAAGSFINITVPTRPQHPDTDPDPDPENEPSIVITPPSQDLITAVINNEGAMIDQLDSDREMIDQLDSDREMIDQLDNDKEMTDQFHEAISNSDIDESPAKDTHSSEGSIYQEPHLDTDLDISNDEDEVVLQRQLEQDIAQNQELGSETNSDSDSDSDSESDSDINYPLELARHLLSFHGCDPGTHQQTREQHLSEEHLINNHYSLEDITHITGRLPDILNCASLMKSDSLLRRNPPDWPLAFEGIRSDEDRAEEEERGDEEERIHVCLHSSEQQHRPMQARFDIDSIIGFADSLAFAKQGILIDLAPQFYHNFHTNLHLYYPVVQHTERGPRPVQAKLQDIPHYHLGKVIGQDDISISIFFPAQFDIEKPTNFPGKKDGQKHRILREWTDNILLPAIASCLPSDVAQHLPASWIHARQNAQARNREAESRTNKSTSRHQSLYYPLQPHLLHNIWLDIVERTQLHENAIYAGVQLVFSSKNTKNIYKSPTLYQLWMTWFSNLEPILNHEYLDTRRFWIDLGKETICQDWALPQQELARHASPATYLYRTCCLESFYRWSSFNKQPARASKTLYTTAMLNDSCDMRIEMGLTSPKRHAGWVFSQFYNSYKEITDVAKVKPFHSPFLNKLAWDPKVAAMIEHQGKGSPARIEQLRRSYIDSKARLAQGLSDSLKKSYSIREEHRITLEFLSQMALSLDDREWDGQPDIGEGNLPFWELSSNSYLTFLAYNANKFLLAFEWILTLNQDGAISYEHCKVLAMLLKALKHCYDTTPLDCEDGLWRNTWHKRRQQSLTHGMGLQKTIRESGYGWFLPKINWEAMTFQSHLSDMIRYNDTALRETYRKRWAAVKDIKDDLARLEAAGQWLCLYQSNRRIRAYLLNFIAHLTIRYFRKELFRSIKKEIRPEYQEAALAGEIALCKQSLTKILVPALDRDLLPEEEARLNIMQANRCKISTVEEIVNFLWDFNDGLERIHWEKRGYRSLHQRALEIIKTQCGAQAADKHHLKTKRIFVLTTWIVPYPNKQQFLQKARSGGRLWLSIYHRQWAERIPEGTTILWSELVKEKRDRIVKKYYINKQNKPVMTQFTQFMYKWGLVGENYSLSMQATPGLDQFWVYQGNASMEAIGELLEEMWQESDESEG